ncbi:TetR/AcrR family transcriptional regulator [Cellulomonas sp. HZM]|uniref:TetR/AcrR family transcriptional regulator n=1 Tax=Cellulomonas sp. HZM TaxID=1454010 RepID=UPI0004931BE9|nr:TetR-like C-terminal domain-containing protein [Cellulomonas sp. HZM]
MPTPERTTLPAVVAAARAIVEEHGSEGLTMQAVAQRVGVRAPSLYKRVASRDALVGLVVESTLTDLTLELEAAERGADEPRAALVAIAQALRTFALAHPACYAVALGPLPAASRPAHELLVTSSAPVLRATSAVVGSADALAAARTVTAWATGFLAMELSGAFRLGGEVGPAFDYGIALLADALAAR